MQRVRTLLQKLTELSENNNLGVIDTDLMLDYTRVLYADLLEERKKIINKPEPDLSVDKVNQVIYVADEEPGLDAAPQPAQYAQTSTLYDIRTMIGINDKYLFITELFKDDKAAYDDAIKSINNFTNVNEAIAWTEKELERKYNWDKENETTQSFYSLLNNCFPSM